MKVLVTGGAGYIGSHTCVELLDAGHEVHVLDNLSNSSEESLRRVQDISGKTLAFSLCDLRDMDKLDALLKEHSFDAVIHFAGLKSVAESLEIPLAYYDNNIAGTLNLLRAMNEHGPRCIVFSSSATVYGEPARVPITEDFPLSATNAYGRSKLMIEEILSDLFVAEPDWRIALLRYFNPVGAHESGRIGEDPSGRPNNLMPFISQVAVGQLPELQVFGSDYPTVDGSGVRDYIHVVDLSKGHVSALQKLAEKPGLEVYNLGTGNGYSVLQMVEAFERINQVQVPYQVVGRRAGDIATCYADTEKAARELNWRAELGLEAMVRDTWRWQSMNPQGYTSQ